MAAPLFVAVPAGPALAQKPGGILKMYSPDSPASMSVHEEATFVAEGPMMGVFNMANRSRPGTWCAHGTC
jgi:peptide/nickel transport system substrate-binding protein